MWKQDPPDGEAHIAGGSKVRRCATFMHLVVFGKVVEGFVSSAGVHSPSLVDLPSSFERKCMAFSRSTSHLL
ncbi:protein ECT2-like isoform X3 [Arapaima gigas]